MNRLRNASALVLALGVAGALTACSQDSDEATESAPTAPTSSETSTPSITAGAGATTPATDSASVLGPDGFGALTLGMDRAQAVASGTVEPVDESNGGCALSQLSGAPGDATPAAPEVGSGIVYLSSNLGVAAIVAYPGVTTPEGIGIGSPVSAVDQAYPDWDPSDDLQRGAAAVPGNGEAVYRIAYDDAGAVTEVTLQFADQDCYE